MTVDQSAEISSRYLSDSATSDVPVGYKLTEVGIIPEDWQAVNLGELSDVRMCKRILAEQTQKVGPIPFYKIGTFGGEPDAFIPNSLYEEFTAKFSFPNKGDVLISAAGTLGKTVVYDGNPAYFQDSNIVWLDIDKKKLLNNYLYQYYNVIRWASSEGSTIARLYNGIIRASLITLPPIQEQTVIANALSDVDALIQELEKLIAKKQAIKTATMQQLLTGRTRLPAFAYEKSDHHPDGRKKGYKPSELGEIPEDWSISVFEKLCRVFTKQTGFDYSAYIKPSLIQVYRSGYIPFIQNKDFCAKNINFDTDYYIPRNIAVNFPNIMLDEKSLLVSISGSIGNVGVFENQTPSFIGGAIAIGKFYDPELIDWVMFYMLSEQGQRTLFGSVKSGSHQNLTLNDIRGFLMPFPSKEEQFAITRVLSDIQEDIQTLEKRLNKTRQIKQGMMQELLTGKTRLVNA